MEQLWFSRLWLEGKHEQELFNLLTPKYLKGKNKLYDFKSEKNTPLS